MGGGIEPGFDFAGRKAGSTYIVIQERIMFAVVRTGGKQYRVSANDQIIVEKLEGEAGTQVSLETLMTLDGAALGTGAVMAEIVEQKRGEKIIIFKKRRRHNYRRRNGHRQSLTVLKITSIA